MLPQPSRRSAAVAVLVLLAAPVFVTLLWMLVTSDSPVSTARPVSDSDGSVPLELESMQSPKPPQRAIAHEETEIWTPDSLRHQCPGTYPEWSADCFLALEEYFLRVQVRMIGILRPISPYLWKDVLNDLDSDRQLVQHVLADPQCQVDDASIRSDLYDTCHADVLVSYSMFLQRCADTPSTSEPLKVDEHDFEFRRTLPDYLASVDKLADVTSDEYRDLHTEYTQRYYFGGWLLKTCNDRLLDHAPPVSPDELDFSESNPYAQHEHRFGGPAQLEETYRASLQEGLRGLERGGFDRMHVYFTHRDVDALIGLAARLGHEEAQTRYSGGEQYEENLRTENPLVWHIREATRMEVDPRIGTRHAEIAKLLAQRDNRTIDTESLYFFARVWGGRSFSEEDAETARREGVAAYKRLYEGRP